MSNIAENFDAVVIGAGLAGLSSAYTLAKNGRSVLVLERGTYPGSKSITGGRLYLNQVRALEPELWGAKDAPFERSVSRERITMMTEDSSVSFELSSGGFKASPQHSCTVLRSKLDQWLSAKAEEKGALVVAKTKAEGVRREGRSVFVKTGDDEVSAGVAVLAEGSNRRLAAGLGLCKSPQPGKYATGVKEVLELPEKTMDERFGLEGGEGVANLFLGAATNGMKGGGFLYTNRSSVSLGIVVGIDVAMEGRTEVHGMFEDFKAHRAVSRLIKGAKSVEYSAHTIPEGGYDDISRLCDDNVLVVGDAAGFALNMGFTVRGMDTAIASGHIAGVAAHEALQRGDLSRNSLSAYEAGLRESFVLKDMHNYRKMVRFLDNRRIYSYYPREICEVFEGLMTFDRAPKKGIKDFALDEIRRLELVKVMGDLWGALRWL